MAPLKLHILLADDNKEAYKINSGGIYSVNLILTTIFRRVCRYLRDHPHLNLPSKTDCPQVDGETAVVHNSLANAMRHIEMDPSGDRHLILCFLADMEGQNKGSARNRTAFINCSAFSELPSNDAELQDLLGKNRDIGEFYGTMMHEILHVYGCMHSTEIGVMGGTYNIANFLDGMPSDADERDFLDPISLVLMAYSSFGRACKHPASVILSRVDGITLALKLDEGIRVVVFTKCTNYTTSFEVFPAGNELVKINMPSRHPWDSVLVMSRAGIPYFLENINPHMELKRSTQ